MESALPINYLPIDQPPPLAVVAIEEPSRGAPEWTGIFILLAVASLAVLPGWLPGRIFVPGTALDSQQPTATVVQRTTQAVRQIRQGEAPLWNPGPGLGEPLLSRGSLGALAPTILPHLILNPT